jgi:tetratricopeptide (TPR) repeat protein
LARIDKRRTQRTRANARPVKAAPRRGSTAPALEDTMFFPRMRRHAKWMFVALALVFGLGFVIFGVGAGGTGIGDIFRDNQNGGGGPSVKSALAETRKHPDSPAAWQELANAYRTVGDTTGAVSAQLRYTEVAPKDPDGFRTLASDYFAQAQAQAQAAQNAQVQTEFSGSVSPAGQGPTYKGEALFGEPLSGVSPSTSSAYATAIQEQTSALRNAVGAYEKVAALLPRDPNVQLELGNNAIQAGDAATAIRAFERYLKLAPDSSDAPLIERQLKQLRQQTGG